MVGVGLKRMDNKTDKELEELVKGDAFCVLPWIHMHPWPDGRVFTCCLSEHDQPIGDLNEQTLEECTIPIAKDFQKLFSYKAKAYM